MADNTAPFAISCGDPAGIGPEIIGKSWIARKEKCLHPFFAVGDISSFAGIFDGPVIKIHSPNQAADAFSEGLPVLHVQDSGPLTLGSPSMEGAGCALQALELSCGLARSGSAGAVVTGPVSKEQLYKVGFTHDGQTEFISERCGVARRNAVMLLAGPSLRVIPMTIHMPMHEVPKHITRNLVISRGRAAHRGMTRNFGIKEPRLAIAGLNPHAGENGHMGREELDIMIPALEELRNEGINISNPLPADTMFHKSARSQYDVALCPYHDQALIPLKTIHFYDGVNMTLGLPIVRTSPDHGTAFNIAGQNIANPDSMIAAIQMAKTAVDHRKVFDA